MSHPMFGSWHRYSEWIGNTPLTAYRQWRWVHNGSYNFFHPIMLVKNVI